MIAGEARSDEFDEALLTVLHHASVASPFYRDAGWAERLRGGAKVALEELPITPKSTVREQTAHFHAVSVPESHGKIIDKFTSGSTGEPMHVRKSAWHFHVNDRENARLKEGWDIERHRSVLMVKSATESAPFGSVDLQKNGRRTVWTLAGLDAS